MGDRESTAVRERKHEALATVRLVNKDGDVIFHRGDEGDELFFIRRGAVRILLPIVAKHTHHLATFGRGDFIGEMSFLDGAARSADAVAFTDTDLYALSRRRFDEFSSQHKRVAINLFEGIARMLALRMRFTNAELRLLQVS